MLKMHGKQFIIELGDDNAGVLAIESVIVTVENDGAGPYLQVRCQELEGGSEEECNSIGLCSLEDIDALSMFLKKILSDAIEADINQEASC